MSPDNVYMRLALEQASLAANANEVPVGAVIVKDGCVLAVGHNTCIASNDPSGHAELVALRAAARKVGNYRLDGCDLYVTLEPCPMCAGAILHARIRRVIFGTQDPKTGAAGSAIDLFSNKQLNHHTQVEAGILAVECSTQLQNFFQSRRKEQKLQAQPIHQDVLRTPELSFAAVPESTLDSRYFQLENGWRMHYWDEGPASAVGTVVLIHDLPSWGYRFQEIVVSLSQFGVRVITPDLVGFGQSDKPKKEAVHTVALHVNALRSLISHLQLSKFSVVGEGGGGILLALALANAANLAIKKCYQVTLPSDEAMESKLYPHAGYEAALRAAPGLKNLLAKETEKDDFPPCVRLTGSAEFMARQIIDGFSCP